MVQKRSRLSYHTANSSIVSLPPTKASQSLPPAATSSPPSPAGRLVEPDCCTSLLFPGCHAGVGPQPASISVRLPSMDLPRTISVTIDEHAIAAASSHTLNLTSRVEPRSID